MKTHNPLQQAIHTVPLDIDRAILFRLFSAVEEGQIEIFDRLVNQHQIDVKHGSITLYCWNVLFTAVFHGQIKMFEHLVATHHFDVNKEKDAAGRSVFLVAAATEHVAMLDHLVEKYHFDVEQEKNFRGSALAQAVINNRMGMLDHLVQKYLMDVDKEPEVLECVRRFHIRPMVKLLERLRRIQKALLQGNFKKLQYTFSKIPPAQVLMLLKWPNIQNYIFRNPEVDAITFLLKQGMTSVHLKEMIPENEIFLHALVRTQDLDAQRMFSKDPERILFRLLETKPSDPYYADDRLIVAEGLLSGVLCAKNLFENSLNNVELSPDVDQPLTQTSLKVAFLNLCEAAPLQFETMRLLRKLAEPLSKQGKGFMGVFDEAHSLGEMLLICFEKLSLKSAPVDLQENVEKIVVEQVAYASEEEAEEKKSSRKRPRLDSKS